MNKQQIKICCIGAGYVGGPTMAVIADKCKNLIIKVVDINQKRIDDWNNEDLSCLPVFEPGLAEIVGRTRNKNLFFTSKIEESIMESDIVFMSVNTPIKQKGIGAGKASDLRWVESSARQIASASVGHTIVVEKSTLPVKTAYTIKNILNSYSNNESGKTPKKTFSVLSNPEFLAEGTAINDLLFPDRVLIGGDNTKAINLLRDIYLNWVPAEKIISTNLWSSELSKLTANAFLAQRISSINSISAVCEVTGADIHEVSKAVGTDTRIGAKFLHPGPGFGGSCFKKDILNLVYLCNYYGLDQVANFWEEVVKINDWQKDRIYKIIVEKLFGNLANKKLSILGFAFKANTNDTRESPAISICADLINEGAKLVIHDPKVDEESIIGDIKNYLRNKNLPFYDCGLEFEKDIYNSVEESDAIIILTEWEDYSNLNWQKISRSMRKPGWVFDTRNIIQIEKVKSSGLNIWCLGVGI